MTVQDILMGFDAMTGQRITLTEHEQTFAEYLEYYDIRRPGWEILIAERGHAGAWKKADQIGYYRALQEDWETARDDELTPLVVDKFSDLPETVQAAVEFREREARGIRGRFGWDVWTQWLDLPAEKRINFLQNYGVAPTRSGLIAARIEEILAAE